MGYFAVQFEYVRTICSMISMIRLISCVRRVVQRRKRTTQSKDISAILRVDLVSLHVYSLSPAMANSVCTAIASD